MGRCVSLKGTGALCAESANTKHEVILLKSPEISSQMLDTVKPSFETMLLLQFTKDPLPDAVITDFQNLNKFSEQVK